MSPTSQTNPTGSGLRGSRHRLRIALLGVVCAAGLFAAVTASAHNASAASAGKVVNVKLHNFMFMPAQIRIKAGTTVRWHWLDGSVGTHNVTSKAHKGGLRFKSASTKTSGYYSVKFTKKGVYYYECTIHPLTMQGKITVD
jgi:plastocyanin